MAPTFPECSLNYDVYNGRLAVVPVADNNAACTLKRGGKSFSVSLLHITSILVFRVVYDYPK
jgi:hypothetical protein